MTFEPHERAIGSLRAVALDAPDIDRLATFYEQLAGWRRGLRRRRVDHARHRRRLADRRATGPRPRAAPLAGPGPPPAGPPRPAGAGHRRGGGHAPGELGATLLRRNERWHTLADPAGHPFDLCRNPDDPRTTLMGVMLDCPDAKALSRFYAELLGKPVTYEARRAWR